jgi:hypothetical protein
MAKGVVITTTNYQHLRKVNVVLAGTAGTSQPEWTSVTDDGRNTFETVVKVTPAVAGLKTVIVPNDTPPGYRYWRLNVDTALLPVNSTNVAEIQLRTSTGGADQTAPGGGSIVVSGTLAGAGSSAVDNDPSTTWHSATGQNPALWRYDFGVGVLKAITEIAIQAHPSNAAYSPALILVQYSSDDAAWTTSWSISSPAAWTGGEIRVFTKP